jgi:EamA domain-containing membrane protein RarD
MSSRIVLALVQAAVGWFVAPYVVAYLPRLGVLNLFVYAVVFAVLVWVVGLVLSRALKNTRTPSRETFVGSLVGALIGAAAITFVVAVVPGLLVLMPGIPARAYPLLGAVLGYLAR